MQKYCNPRCARKWRIREHKLRNPDAGKICSANVGAISELLVSADLLGKGYSVYRSVSPAASCDLLAFHGDDLYRVEVTTAGLSSYGKVMIPVKDASLFNILAVYIRETQLIRYYISEHSASIAPPRLETEIYYGPKSIAV